MLRAALGGAAGVVLGGPLLPSAAGAPGAQSAGMIELGDDLFLVRRPGEANVLVQRGPDGVVLVDGGSAAGSEGLMALVAGLSGGAPVGTIFNTHWHVEQTGSNELLGRAGARIIAHENTRLWLTTDVTWPWDGRRFDPLPEIAQPNDTFYVTGEMDSGVRYGHISDAAHTDGDMYV
jgi:glyoxylase-like metal-dependent hydrolase (beta-lactamase superfamily II)